ncbi:MAG: hypothetical protein NTY70_06990 [Burkholderiales bacterium]|nr:hypothetical protein [Burkholderiales bacterium]
MPFRLSAPRFVASHVGELFMGLNPAQESDTALLPRLLNRSISAARILLLCAAMIIVPAGLYYYLVIHEQINYRDQRAFRSLGEVQLQLSQAIEVAKAFSQYAPVSDFHVGLADFARAHEVLLQAQDSLPKPRMVDVIIAERLKGRAPEVFWEFVSPLDQQQTFSDLLAPEAASKLVAEQILNVVRLEIGGKKTAPQNWKYLNLAQLQAKKNEAVIAYFARLALLAKCVASPPVHYADRFETALALHLCEEAKDVSYQDFDDEREAIKLIYEKAEKECEAAFKNTEIKSKEDKTLGQISKPEKAKAASSVDKKEVQESLKACALNNLRAWMPKGSKTAEELALRMHAGLSLAKTSAPYSLRKNVPECRKNNGTSLAFWSEQFDDAGTARIYRCGARDQQIPVEIALKNFLGQGNWFDALDAVYLVREDGKVLLTLQKPITKITGESKLYQPATLLPKVLDLLALLDDESSAGEADKTASKTLAVGARMRDFEIDNRAVRAYTQQVQLPVRFCSSKTEACVNEKLFLVGAREQHLMAATQMLEPGTFLLWLCVLLVVLFFWPWLNLFFSQQLQAVPARSVFALVASALLLVLPIVLGLWAWGSYRAAVDVMKESAKNVAVKMANNWQAELDVAVSELMNRHSTWTDIQLIGTNETVDASAFKLTHSHLETMQDKNSKAYFDCFILTAHTEQQARVRNCVPHAAFLASDNPPPLPILESVFEFDREGRIDKKILQYTQLLPAYGAAATAEGRGYLQALVNHQAWPWPKPKKIAGWSLDGFVIERLYNRADAQLSSQLALALHKDIDKDKDNRRQFISGSFPAYSFEFMPPPPGFQYVVIDNQTGIALYHSAPGRVLAENLFNESQQDNRLLAAVKYGNTDSFGGHYHGQSVQFHVQPLAYVPWTLVMIAELRPVQLGLANITLLTLGFCLSPLLVLLACYVLARLSGKRAAWAWPQWQLRRRYRPLCGLLLVHALSQYLVLAGLSYLSFVLANGLIVISTLAINVALLSQAGKWAAPDSVVWLAQRVWQRIAPEGALMPAKLSAWQLCAFALLLLCQIAEVLLLLTPDALWHGAAAFWSSHAAPLLLALLLMLTTSLLLRRSLLRIATEISSEADSGSATSSQAEHQAIPDFYRDYRRWAVLVMAILVWLPASVMLRNSADQIEQRLQYVAGVALAERWQAQQQKLQDFGQMHFPERFESNERFALPALREQGLREIFSINDKNLRSFQFAATHPPANRTCSESKNRESTFTQIALELAGKLTPDQAMLFAAGDAISQQTPKRYKTGKFAGDDEDYCVIDSGASAIAASSATGVNQYAVFLPRITQLLSWPGRLALLVLAYVISSLALRGLMRTVLSAKFVAHFPPAPALALPEKWARHSDAPKRLLLQRELTPLSPSLRLQIEAELDITKSLHETVLTIGKLALQSYRNRWDKLPETQQQLLYLVARGNYPLPTHSPAVEGLLRLGWLNHDPQLQVASESLRRFVLRAAPEAQQRLWEAPPPDDLWQTLRYPLGVAIMLLLALVALVGGDMLKILAGGVASATGLLAAFKQVQQMMKGGS